jgi:hypothetical protein
VRVDDMTTHVPERILRVRRWLYERGVPCIEHSLTIFLGNGIDEWLDVEVGWPIAEAEVEAADGVVIRELAATRAAEHLHQGPYEELRRSGRAERWGDRHGRC